MANDLYEEYIDEYEGDNLYFVSSQDELNNVKEEYENVKPVLVSTNIKSLIEDNNCYYIEKKKTFKRKELSTKQRWTIWKSKYLNYLTTDAKRELEKIMEELIR